MKCGFCDKETSLRCLCGQPVCASHIYVLEVGHLSMAVCQNCRDRRPGHVLGNLGAAAEQVRFDFNPYLSENPDITEVFADDLARTIWCGIKRNHLVDQYFNRNCLRLAKELRRKKWRDITGKQLNGLFRWLGMLGSEEWDVGDQLLPFIKGEKKFEFVLPG